MSEAPAFAIGDAVTPKAGIYEAADDHSPGGYLAQRGDKLIVRHFGSQPWRYFVSHEGRTDGNSFGVQASEIERWQP